MDDEVPKRLRAAREEHRLSLRELARRLDVSPSAISQIETGRTRPSVSTLYAIVRELGMSLDELFQPGDFNGEQAAQVERRPALVSDAVPECVQRESTRTILKLETGVRWERLTAVPVGDIDFLWVTYPPGSTTSADGSLMRHPGHEFGVLLTGKLEVTVEFDTYELTAHDSISFASTTPHLLRNTTDEPTTAIWFVIGRRGAAPHIEPSAPAPPLDGDSAT